MELKMIYNIRTALLGSAIQEAHDRVSSGRYNSVDELIELRNAIPAGEKRLQDLKEIKGLVDKDFQDLKYLLN